MINQPVIAFITSQKGMAETFQIVLPDISQPSGTVGGTIRVDNVNGYSIGDGSIVVDGITGTLKAGDVVKFGNHSKVYMLTTDATASNGSATLNISPTLRDDLVDGEIIIYINVPFTVRLNNDIQEFAVGVTGLRQFEVDFIEAI